MPSFNDLDALEAFLLLKVQNAMTTTVASEVKQLESKNVKEVVYNVYSPKIYDRDMDDGGLSDVENMSHNVSSIGQSVELTVDNKTISNPSYNPNNKSPFEVAGLVEYGSNNGYGYYDYPIKNKDSSNAEYLKPRPFIQKTKDELESGKAREIIVKALIKEGLSSI